MVLMIALASCSKPTPATETAQTPAFDSLGTSNKELVKKYVDALLTGNTAGMADYLGEGYMGFGPAMKDSVNKQQNLTNWKKSWEEQFSSIKYDEIVSLTPTIKPETNSRVAGDWVLNWGTVSVVYKNGQPPVKFSLHTAYMVVNGKIARSHVYYNVADILGQQGFTFVPPAKK